MKIETVLCKFLRKLEKTIQVSTKIFVKITRRATCLIKMTSEVLGVASTLQYYSALHCFISWPQQKCTIVTVLKGIAIFFQVTQFYNSIYNTSHQGTLFSCCIFCTNRRYSAPDS